MEKVSNQMTYFQNFEEFSNFQEMVFKVRKYCKYLFIVVHWRKKYITNTVLSNNVKVWSFVVCFKRTASASSKAINNSLARVLSGLSIQPAVLKRRKIKQWLTPTLWCDLRIFGFFLQICDIFLNVLITLTFILPKEPPLVIFSPKPLTWAPYAI